jgi:hypothetical protein
VADIKHAARRPHSAGFIQDAPVMQGHLPARKFNDLCSGAFMGVEQRRLPCFYHRVHLNLISDPAEILPSLSASWKQTHLKANAF